MTLAEIRALLEQTAQASAENTAGISEIRIATAENTRAIAEMRADNVERAAKHDREMAEIRALQAENTKAIAEMRVEQRERAAQHDREMAEIRAAQDRTEKIVSQNSAAISEMRAEQRERAAQHDREMAEIRALQSENSRGLEELRASQARIDRRFERIMESHQEMRTTFAEARQSYEITSNDVSTLKGWGVEFLCERRPGLFADALNLRSIELLPREQMLSMAMDAASRGIVSGTEAVDLHSGDVYFYGRRAEDDTPVYLIVQASFAVSKRDVKRASSQADTLDVILRHDGPPEVTGVAIPVVAGTRLGTDPVTGATPSLWDVTFVQIENANQLTA